MKKKMPDEEWEKKERDIKYPKEITHRKGDEDVNNGNNFRSSSAELPG